jgi:hypothetical protein
MATLADMKRAPSNVVAAECREVFTLLRTSAPHGPLLSAAELSVPVNVQGPLALENARERFVRESARVRPAPMLGVVRHGRVLLAPESLVLERLAPGLPRDPAAEQDPVERLPLVRVEVDLAAERRQLVREAERVPVVERPRVVPREAELVLLRLPLVEAVVGLPAVVVARHTVVEAAVAAITNRAH